MKKHFLLPPPLLFYFLFTWLPFILSFMKKHFLLPPPPSLPVLMEKDPCIIFSSSVVGTSPTSCSHTRWWEPILVPCHTLTPSIFHLMKKVLPLTPPFTSCSNYFLKSSGGNLFYFLFPRSMVGTSSSSWSHAHPFSLSFMKKALPLTPPPLPPITSCSHYFLKTSGGNLFYFLFTHSMVGTENRAVLHHSFIHSFFHSYRKWGGSGGGGWSHVHPHPIQKPL